MLTVELPIIAEALLRLIAAAPKPPTIKELYELLLTQRHEVVHSIVCDHVRLLKTHLLIGYQDQTKESWDQELDNLERMLDPDNVIGYVPDESTAARVVLVRAGWLLLNRKTS